MAKKAKKSKKGKKKLSAAQRRSLKKATAASKRARRKEKKMAAKKSKKGKRKTKRRAKRSSPGATLAAAMGATTAKPRKRRSKKRRSGGKRRAKRRTRKTARATKAMQVPGTRVKIVKVPQLKTIMIGKTPPRRGKKGRRRKKRLQDNPVSLAALGTSAGDGSLFGLLENPAGPLSRSALEGLGTASLGVGVGLTIASLLDRYVATRTPKDGKHPWYGRDAAAIINSRPDAWRMGAQAGGAVLAMAGAYATRGRAWIPWLLSGTAIGFGAKLVEQVLNWYLMPALLKSEDPTKATMASRLYALEQEAIQKQVAEAYTSKAKMQVENEPVQPIILQPASPILQLGHNPWAQHAAQQAQQQETPAGKAQAASDGSGHLGRLIPTGRVGACSSCNGKGGCYESCPDLVICNECPGTAARTCEVPVPPGTDIRALAAQADVDIASVNALNDGTPEDYWRVGNTVRLPFALCRYVAARDGGPPADYVPPPAAEPAIVATAALHRPLAGIDLTSVGVEE